jgi:hypothetical protein
MNLPRLFLLSALGLTIAGCVSETAVPNNPAAQAQTTNGKIEPVTGLPFDALVAAVGIPDLGNEMLYTIIYLPGKVAATQLAVAPARVCATRGRKLISSEKKALEHPSEIPGTMKLVFRCK